MRPYGHQLSRPEPRAGGLAPFQARRPRLIIHPMKPRFKDSTRLRKRRRPPLGHGDALQVQNGLGLSLLDDKAVRYWGHEYELHGAMGQGGSKPGWTRGMLFVEDANGSYGIIAMTKHEQTYKADNFLCYCYE